MMTKWWSRLVLVFGLSICTWCIADDNQTSFFHKDYNPLAAGRDVDKQQQKLSNTYSQQAPKQQNQQQSQQKTQQSTPSSNQATSHSGATSSSQKGYYANESQRRNDNPWLQKNPWSKKMNNQKYSDPSYQPQTKAQKKSITSHRNTNLQAIYGRNQKNKQGTSKNKKMPSSTLQAPSSSTLSPY